MRKIYPSSAAFMKGPVVNTTKHSSCLRYLGAQAHSGLTKEELHQDIAAEYSALGTLNEFLYAVKLERDKIKYEREVPFKVEFKGAVISGRMDFVLEDGTIVELKSVTSETVYKRVFEGGQPEPAHVAQLVSYLAFLNRSEGRLVVTYFELTLDEETQQPNGYQALAEKTFHVQAIDGDIIIDGVKYPHTVRDLAQFYAKVEQIVSNPWTALPPKPLEGGGYGESACNFCPLKQVCATTDNVARWLQESTQALLVKQPPKPAKIQVLTKRRKENKEKKKNVTTNI